LPLCKVEAGTAMTPTEKELEEAREWLRRTFEDRWRLASGHSLSREDRTAILLAEFRADGQREVFEQARKLMCRRCREGYYFDGHEHQDDVCGPSPCEALEWRAAFPELSKLGES
jgi:hypothetical protein